MEKIHAFYIFFNTVITIVYFNMANPQKVLLNLFPDGTGSKLFEVLPPNCQLLSGFATATCEAAVC